MSFSSLQTPSLSELGLGLWNLFAMRRDTAASSTTSVSSPSLTSRTSSGITMPRQQTGTNSSGVGVGGGEQGGSSSSSVSNQKGESTENLVMEILISIVLSGAIYATGIGIWNLSRTIIKSINGTESEDVDQVKSSAVYRLTKLLEKRGRPLGKPLRLSSHESHIAEDIIDPEDMDAEFKDIGGLDHLKQEIWELAVLPLLRPELFMGTSKLVQQPSGILLYGKPGTGKTMLAKAVAKESQAVFIPIKLSKVLNKWVGESNKLVSATFSLARKLAPSIIFIDELDTFLSDTVDPSASKSMESVKSEFLTEWDGIATNRDSAPVLVLGATNRPHLLDPAILRRLPRSFAVPLPTADGREQIMRKLFEDQAMDDEAKDYLRTVAHVRTKGYSGSDLKELCKAAAMEPVREVTAEESRKAVMGETKTVTFASIDEKGGKISPPELPKLRPVSRKDLETALNKVRRTGQSAREYGAEMAYEREHGTDPQSPQSGLDDAMNNISPQLSQLLQLLQSQPQALENMLQTFLAQTAAQSSGKSNDGDDYDDLGDVPPPQAE